MAERDKQAQALWQAGKVAAAEAIFRDIIDDDETGRYAQTAYGELFSIARAQKNERKRVKLWTAYLERFPRGRYADDARAGLCQREPATEAEACWEAYRRDFPEGAHAKGAPQ